MQVKIKWKPRDAWIGIFYKANWTGAINEKGEMILEKNLWVCIIPMFPIHFRWLK